MKKIVASVGLVALGASGLQTASAQSVGVPDASKPWSVALTLRGFYDDNVGTIPNDQVLLPGEKRDTFGFEVSPSFTLSLSPDPTTTMNLGALYSLKYYDTKPPNSTDHTDQAFTFNAGLSHNFSEQLSARVSDSFVIGQEPDMLRAGSSFSTFQRVSGDNIRNYGMIGVDAQLTPKVGLGAGYDNAFYDYSAKGAFYDRRPDKFGEVSPSVAGLLNRDEHRAHIEGLYVLQPETKALLGYKFSEIDYLANEDIGGFDDFPGTLIKSDIRNLREHTLYVGMTHNFTPELSAQGRVGGSYVDYYNDPSSSSSWVPYVDANLRYNYAPESYVTLGVGYDVSATDVLGFAGNANGTGSFTLDAESAVVYANISHRLAPNLFGSIMAQFQNSMYHGGDFDGKSEQFYLVGLDLEYRFNPFISAHVGYDYDRLESQDIGRTFDRNRVYIGVTASY